MLNDRSLEPQAADSHFLDSLDSASLPSEPPSIRNWFSSYVYESNSLGDLQGFDVSEGIFNEEEKKASLDYIPVVDRNNDGLLAGKRETLNGIVKHDESNELEHRDHANVVSGLSDSLSLFSEPPDIRNWLSSYLYESPLVDTTDGFSFSDYDESQESKACDAELPTHSRVSEVVVRCVDLVNGSEQNYQSGSIDSQKLEPSQVSNVPNAVASERVSQHIFPEQNDSVKDYINTITDGKETKAKSDSACMHRTTQSRILVNVENYAGGQEVKHPRIRKRDNPKNILSNEGNFGKENSDTGFPENGFVSTRKSGERANNENFTKPQRVQSQPLSKDMKHGLKHAENTDTRRHVLSETTNIHLPSALETTGKWCCPQRNKPNLGPPLKQVRLEQWLRRL